MSQCQGCHQREGVVRLTQIVNGEVSTVHLCSRCAAERGIETEAAVTQTPLGAFLAAMEHHGAVSLPGPPQVCPGCGATLEDFRASGRTGCAACWTVFEAPLRDLLRRLHGATRHVGEAQRPGAVAEPTGAADRDARRSALRQQLQRAVAAEEFERAAALRDQLRELEG